MLLTETKRNMERSISIKAARINTGLTLKEASAILGMSYQTLSAKEKDCTNISRILAKQIAELYGVPENFLFFGDYDDFKRQKQEKIKEMTQKINKGA